MVNDFGAQKFVRCNGLLALTNSSKAGPGVQLRFLYLHIPLVILSDNKRMHAGYGSHDMECVPDRI